MGHEEHPDALLGLEPQDEFGKVPRRPGLDRDVRKATRKDGGPLARTQAQLGKDSPCGGLHLGGNAHRRQDPRQFPADDVFGEAVLVLDLAHGAVRGHGFLEGRVGIDAEVEPEGGGEEGVHLGAPEDDAPDALQVGGDRQLKPGAIERRREDESGGQGVDFAQEGRELRTAFRRPLLEGI